MKNAYINGIILDGSENMIPQKGKIIFTDGSKIEKITDESAADADLKGYDIVDLGGKYLMPGLINLHVHLPANGKPKKKESDPV